jgi:hypothetical protein
MNASPGTSDSGERKWVWLLCLAAAIHVFVFCAAFPVFNQVDEGCHFDLVVRYSQAQLPRGLPPMCQEASLYLLTYSSPEYMQLAKDYPGGDFPIPAWTQTSLSQSAWREAAFAQAATNWDIMKKMPVWTNYQASQPPLYYALAGIWWHMGQWFGERGLGLVYWLRFLNVVFVAALVWIGYYAACEIFPRQNIFTLGVPALIAFAPVQAFYSIQNDVLSPVCFGVTFICLARLWRADVISAALGTATGLSLAATYLTKLTNVPLLAVSGLVILLKIFQLARGRTLQRSIPALVILFFCAALPMAAWVAWMKIAFGDFSGSAEKLRFITWTLKPFHEWWHHPIFTPQGLWAFVSELAYSFWQGGEIHWHANQMDLPPVDTVYVMLTLAFLIFAVMSLSLRKAFMNDFQRRTMWFCLCCVLAGSFFLAYLSIIYDFGICMDPSPEHPYLAEGRLILGAMIPCLLLYLLGFNYLLAAAKNWVKIGALAAIILFMLVSEIFTDWTVFSSRYNWYHLP